MVPKLVILDCWNTLFYTDSPKHHFQVFFERLGLDFDNYQHLKLFEQYFFLQKENYYESSIEKFCAVLEKNNSDIVSLSDILYNGLKCNNAYDDTFLFLDKLNEKGIKICVLSNTDYLSWKSLNTDYSLSQHIDFYLTSYYTGLMKPNPKIFEHACNIASVDKSEAIMIGDSLKDDYLASQEFGMGESILLDRKGKHDDQTNFKNLRDVIYALF